MTGPQFERRNHGRNHSYWLDGEKLPGVTTILGDGLSKPGLIGWAARTVAAYAVDNWDDLSEQKPSERLKVLERAHNVDRDTAAVKGTRVHALADKLARGEEVQVPEELAGHVEAYVKLLDQFDPQPVIAETPVVHIQWRYAGTVDLIADFPHHGRLVCDIKTARSGVFPDNALQLAAYRWAQMYLGDDGILHPMPETDGAAVIHVRADGYSLIPVDTGPDVHRYFLYCQQLWRWANDRSKTIVGEELMPA